eukprot:TRINITY_DN6536_c5_g1_i1.p1 TRINITY_DN6536_c5_g1~~TRINITY_DN6536_c5_g1_i1.p1  ORF type:complete len:250 (+),score=40.69 TRINITY_DN6536_c5_g1_i1:50-751(+)
MGLEVIGAGFGRTGTTSLKDALEHLGCGKCHHMSVVKQNSVEGWIAAHKAVKAGNKVDWDALLGDYGAAVDWPSAAFYKELAEYYPEAKVVLTVRDPEKWYQSVNETLYAMNSLAPWYSRYLRMYTMVVGIVWDGVFGGRFSDKERTLQLFNGNIAEVKRTIPAERLLVFKATDGWGPLCAFLDKPVPSIPFPHSNEGVIFKRVVRFMKIFRAFQYAVSFSVIAYVLKWSGAW